MARKLDYKTCKKLLNDLSTNTQDKQYIDELLKINNCNLEEFSKGIAHQAFYIKGISSLHHVHNLKMDIQKQRLSAYEAELLLTLNNISGFEEALFELDKIIRKQDIIKKYKDLFEAAQIEANQKVRIDSYQIDFAQMMHNKKELSDFPSSCCNLIRNSFASEVFTLRIVFLPFGFSIAIYHTFSVYIHDFSLLDNLNL